LFVAQERRRKVDARKRSLLIGVCEVTIRYGECL
jgi:hypothetical protein